MPTRDWTSLREDGYLGRLYKLAEVLDFDMSFAKKREDDLKPYKPTSSYVITPNGKFRTDTLLCLSTVGDRSDTRDSAWSVASILTDPLRFML